MCEVVKKMYSKIEICSGGKRGINIEELKLEIEKDKKFREKIEYSANHLLEQEFPYDVLCWELAEFELLLKKGWRLYSEEDVIKRAEKIFDLSPEYHQLCWKISAIKVYLEENDLYP